MSDLSLFSPEKVYYKYSLVGLGSRFVAHLLDYLILSVVYAVLAFVAFLLIPQMELSEEVQIMAVVAVILLNLFIGLVYFIFFETTWNGQTPGKRAAGIRVISSNGEAVTFGSVLGRNLMRIVDFFPMTYTVGTLTILFNKNHQRLGDMIANTMVVKEETADAPETFSPEELNPLLAERIRPYIFLISEQDFSLVRDFFSRQPKLAAKSADRLARQIADALALKMGLDIADAAEPMAFLQTVGAVFSEKTA